ncbi:3-carboxyethylcatechol 2,3-dioxygenase [Rhodococcus hoagii]|nr:3-carboxyethylcatechol 2,3-dioxygenase [Prescottella equi]
MTLALAALSHAPTYGLVDPGGTVQTELDAALDAVRARVREFDPELTIVIAPDHFNGVFYDMLPAFCVGAQASSVGDWGTAPGPLPVDTEAARALSSALLDAGLDIARSEELAVDHGTTQPLEFIFGRGFTDKIVPIVVNSVGLPLGPIQRSRLLGEAIGRWALSTGRRVLLVASGGLSHDPPVPVFADATPELAHHLISGGRHITLEQRAAREQRILTTAARNNAGEKLMRDINPEFDAVMMDTFSAGDLDVVDAWTTEWFHEEGGCGAQEIRCWIAAFAALSVAGGYRVERSHYWPIHSWATGFAVMTASTTASESPSSVVTDSIQEIQQ